MKHQNIVPLLGVTSTPLQLVSEWMPGGDLTEYVKKHPEVDRLELVCVSPPYRTMHLPSRKLRGVVDGLHYLHSNNVIHGDLRGVRDRSKSSSTIVLTPGQSNILVDAIGRARITDFDLGIVTQNLDTIQGAWVNQGHTARWTAPEILNGEGTYSKQADVFSFAMVMIEVGYDPPPMCRASTYTLIKVFTGAAPFNNRLTVAAMPAIMAAERPPRPTHIAFTDSLWSLTQGCWDQDPHLRPEVSEVSKVLCDS